jgi:LAO/AO transport system ATPase
MPDLEALWSDFRRGNRLALAQLLTAAAQGRDLRDKLQTCQQAADATVVAFTGSGGVGKSTLIGKLIDLLRQRQIKVSVLACDPQSPLSGGALLGDRFRMPSRPDDDGVFIRSLAALPGHGAIAEHLPPMIRLLEIFGFGAVLLETVGAGQGDTGVAALADVVVLLLQPESGDDLQWEKAGILEVADVIAVHKADLPGAEQTAAQVTASLKLSPRETAIPVLLVSSKTGRGVEELWEAIEKARRGRPRGNAADSDESNSRNSLLQLAKIVDDWRAGRLSDEEAADEVIESLLAELKGYLPSVRRR